AFVLRLRPQQVSGSTAPQQPEWEQVYEKALSGKTVKELSGEASGFVVATSTHDDKHVPVVLRLDAKGELLWSKSYPDHGELTDIAVLSNQGRLEGLALSGHRKDAGGGIDGVMTKLSLQGDVLWSYNYGNPQGGVGPFRGLGAGNPRLIYDECWGIQSRGDGGAVMACGTGIEECEPFEDNDALYDECTADPRKTWRSLVVRVNPQGGPIWHRTDSYRFPGEPEEEQAPATASEFVLVTSGGQVASITDLSSGIGLQLLERE
ncbi:MAG: hypothetical protein VX610_03610, partial [SAR324 cluster bacterium]|nr:hypothetical protein [SAR324 cluster bacterium]